MIQERVSQDNVSLQICSQEISALTLCCDLHMLLKPWIPVGQLQFLEDMQLSAAWFGIEASANLKTADPVPAIGCVDFPRRWTLGLARCFALIPTVSCSLTLDLGASQESTALGWRTLHLVRPCLQVPKLVRESLLTR